MVHCNSPVEKQNKRSSEYSGCPNFRFFEIDDDYQTKEALGTSLRIPQTERFGREQKQAQIINTSTLPTFVSRSNSFCLTHTLYQKLQSCLSSFNIILYKLQHLIDLGKLTEDLLTLSIAVKMKSFILLLVFLSCSATGISDNCCCVCRLTGS